MLTVFADGSSKGNPGPAGYAYVIMRDGVLLSAYGTPYASATNNQAELMAAERGLRTAMSLLTPREDILFVSDSLYVLKGMPSLHLGVPAGKLNANLWIALRSMLGNLSRKGHKVATYWCKGHNGVPGNELCDTLAQQAALTQKRQTAKELGKHNDKG